MYGIRGLPLQCFTNYLTNGQQYVSLAGMKSSRQSALPLLNLEDLLIVENIFIFRLLQFSHQWHKKQLPSIFDNYFRYASDVHTYNTRYASKSNFYKARFRTNIGKTTLSTLADHMTLKNSIFSFSREKLNSIY